MSSTKPLREYASTRGADKGAEGHKGRNKLLSFRADIVTQWAGRVSVTVDLGMSILWIHIIKEHKNTSRNPGIACNPPMRPKSIPYWNGDMEINVHATMHFQFSRRPLPVDASGMIAGSDSRAQRNKTKKPNESSRNQSMGDGNYKTCRDFTSNLYPPAQLGEVLPSTARLPGRIGRCNASSLNLAAHPVCRA